MSMNQIASDLYKAISESDQRKVKPYDVKAEVLRTEGDIVWVKIPGGIDETPVQKTNNANPGDQVIVRVSGGKAWLLGNNTSPATDDTVATAASQLAEGASYIAKTASEAAASAQEGADKAWNYAGQAMNASNVAYGAAQTATNQAGVATSSANNSLYQLGIVEDVVGVLSNISKNGNYIETLDTLPITNKWYFVRQGSSPNYSYSVVSQIATEYLLTRDIAIDPDKTYYTRTGSDPYEYVRVDNPVVEDIGTYYEYTNSPYTHYYYELSSVKESINDYLMSRITVSESGLWVQSPNMDSKILLSANEGIVMYGPNGPVAKYGETAMIGPPSGMHVTITTGKLSFCEGQRLVNGVMVDNEVAYISGQRLYITQSVVLTEMRLGNGKWSWKYDSTDDSMFLKWIG